MNDHLKHSLTVFLQEWQAEVEHDWKKAPGATDALASICDIIDSHDYVIMPVHPTAEMILEGLHPARPGSIGDIYREMVRVGKVTA